MTQETKYEIRTPIRTGTSVGYGWEIYAPDDSVHPMLKADVTFMSIQGARTAAYAALDIWLAAQEQDR